jgi:hypothetical protein
MIGTYFADMLATMLKKYRRYSSRIQASASGSGFVASGETLAPVRRFGLDAARETEDADQNGDEPKAAFRYPSS